MSTADAKKLGREHSASFWKARDEELPDPRHLNPHERNSPEWNAYCSGWHAVTSERPGWASKDQYTLVKDMPKAPDGSAEWRLDTGEEGEAIVVYPPRQGFAALLTTRYRDGDYLSAAEPVYVDAAALDRLIEHLTRVRGMML